MKISEEFNTFYSNRKTTKILSIESIGSSMLNNSEAVNPFVMNKAVTKPAAVPSISITMDAVRESEDNQFPSDSVVHKPIKRRYTDVNYLRNARPIKGPARKSAVYTYAHQNLNVINMPIPLDEKFGETKASQFRSRISRKPVKETMSTPRQTFAPNTLAIQKPVE